MESSSQGNRSSRLSKKPKALLRLTVLFFILWLVAWSAAKFLIVNAPLAHADAIAVMSGSAVFKERTRRAAQLYNEGRTPRIILTNDNQQGGWVSEEQRNIPYHEQAERALRQLGVPSEAIEILPEHVSGTYSEALLLRQYAEAQHLRSILIVTSAYHSRRTLWTLREVCAGSGITIGLEAAPPGWQSPRPSLWFLHLRGWQLVPGEYLKMIYYWLEFRN